VVDFLDKDRKICKSEGHVRFPVLAAIRQWDGLRDTLQRRGAELLEDRNPETRERRLEPIVNIRRALEGTLPPAIIARLPEKWELYGDVLVLPVGGPLWTSDTFTTHETEIAAAYAKELGARTVLAPAGPIEGVKRTPGMRFLMGDSALTTHVENGIRYRFDVSRIMFSSGNVDERIRMAGIRMGGETVVDMFAGIGYFTLPVAKYSGAARVLACEINPLACEYLRENIELNGLSMDQDRAGGPTVNPAVDGFAGHPGDSSRDRSVSSTITVLEGDNRDTAPVNTADRVIMGYVGTTHEFLPGALAALKGGRGILHYHETCPNELLEVRPMERVEGAVHDHCREQGIRREVELLNMRKIKSYAPGVTHVVLDVKVK